MPENTQSAIIIGRAKETVTLLSVTSPEGRVNLRNISTVHNSVRQFLHRLPGDPLEETISVDQASTPTNFDDGEKIVMT